MRRTVALLALLALAGCSLPLAKDVHTVGGVEAERRQDAVIQVQPPGPKAGQTPEDVVLGFLGAQSNADARHAIARQFLTREQAAAWQDEAGVQVYDPGQLRVEQHPAPGAAVVVVTSRVSAQVRSDGSYVATPSTELRDSYRLERVRGAWRLASVPPGLRLTSADRRRSLRASDIYYVAPHAEESSPHLVPDRVFLPVGHDLATTLVHRLLQPPSQALAGSATSAVPAGTKVRKIHTSGSGVVTVDLSGLPATMPTPARQAMSAQLVWTLRGLGSGFSGMELRNNGSAFRVPGAGSVQDAGGWESYDAEGLAPRPPYYFISARRLRASVTLPPGPATAGDAGIGGAVPVDAVAVTPDLTRVALLEGVAPGSVTVRIGSLRDSPLPAGVTGRDLRSPSWGSAEQGVWLLHGPRGLVLLRPGGRAFLSVPIEGLPPGVLSALAVARDGVRVALAVGGRLYVGRVEVRPTGPRVVGLAVVLPDLTKVSAVSWAGSTELVVIGSLTRAAQVVRVAVDGSPEVTETLNSSGLQPVRIAASPAGLLLASQGAVYRWVGSSFQREITGAERVSAPVYPG